MRQRAPPIWGGAAGGSREGVPLRGGGRRGVADGRSGIVFQKASFESEDLRLGRRKNIASKKSKFGPP